LVVKPHYHKQTIRGEVGRGKDVGSFHPEKGYPRMKKFLVMAVLAVSLFAMGCKPANDSKPTTGGDNTPAGGQPAAPSDKPETNP